MVDIFVSYASADRDRVAPLARELAGLGWSVWWDREIPIGMTFDEVIEEELEHAKAVLCVWTERGVGSRWVRTEAAEGAARGILVPVILEPVRIPLAFRRIQAADLTDWEGDGEHAGFDHLLAALERVIGDAAPEPVVVESVDPIESAIERARLRADEGDWPAVISLLSAIAPGAKAAGRAEVGELLEAAQRKHEAAELYEEAEVLFADGRWSDVVGRFERILELDPDFALGTDLRTKAKRHLEQERDRQLALDYDHAKQALDAAEWPVAVARFERILDRKSDYEAAVVGLDQARRGLAAAERYRTLRNSARMREWDVVADGVAALTREYPDFGDPDALLDEALAAIADRQSVETQVDEPEPAATVAADEPAQPVASGPQGAMNAIESHPAESPVAAVDQHAHEAASSRPPRFGRMRRRVPTWTLGIVAVASAFLPWLNRDGNVSTAHFLPLDLLWGGDDLRAYEESLVQVAFLVIAFGLVVAWAGRRPAYDRQRRLAGVGLVAVGVVYELSMYMMLPGEYVRFSVGPYLAVLAGVLASMRDPYLLATRQEAAPWEPKPQAGAIALAIAAVCSVAVVAVVASGFWRYSSAFEFNAAFVLGVGRIDDGWLFSYGMVSLATIAAGVVVIVRRHRDVDWALRRTGGLLVALFGGALGTTAGLGLFDYGTWREAIDKVGYMLSPVFWLALGASVGLAFAAPTAAWLRRRLDSRAAHRGQGMDSPSPQA